MKKRLRKKKHLDEFAEWGCQLAGVRNTKVDVDEFLDSFISEAIEGSGCCCVCSLSDEKINVVVELGKMSDNPEIKLAKITTWLDTRSDIEGWRASPLFDLWYGDFENMVK
jgi:uncharacterized protein YggL (DUF469 family)